MSPVQTLQYLGERGITPLPKPFPDGSPGIDLQPRNKVTDADIEKLMANRQPILDYVWAKERVRKVNPMLARCSTEKLHERAERWRGLGMDRPADVVDGYIDAKDAMEVE